MADIDYEDYVGNLRIDKHHLDDENEKQALLFYDWSVKASLAEEAADLAKEAIEQARSVLDGKIRVNYKEYGFEKPPTEAAIKSLLDRDMGIITLIVAHIKAKTIQRTLANAVKALEHKKESLKNEVKLCLGRYYATPRFEQADKGMIEEQEAYTAATRSLNSTAGLSKRHTKKG